MTKNEVKDLRTVYSCDSPTRILLCFYFEHLLQIKNTHQKKKKKDSEYVNY